MAGAEDRAPGAAADGAAGAPRPGAQATTADSATTVTKARRKVGTDAIITSAMVGCAAVVSHEYMRWSKSLRWSPLSRQSGARNKLRRAEVGSSGSARKPGRVRLVVPSK